MNEKKNIHAVALGKLGGRSRTEAKQEAARRNGKRGGRPRKETATAQLEARVGRHA